MKTFVDLWRAYQSSVDSNNWETILLRMCKIMTDMIILYSEQKQYYEEKWSEDWSLWYSAETIKLTKLASYNWQYSR